MPVNPTSITVPMPEEMKAWIATQATAERRTMADIVRFIIQKEMTWQKLIEEKKKEEDEYAKKGMEVIGKQIEEGSQGSQVWKDDVERHRQISHKEAREILENLEDELEKSKCATELSIPSNR